MPRTDWGWLITPQELREWTLADLNDLIVINKPAHVVCHPSKHGPWSSLIGACREVLGVDRLHMPARLDRETSGVVVFAKTAAAGSRLQRAMARREVRKTYLAVVCGTMEQPQVVSEPIGRDTEAIFATRQRVDRVHGRPAQTFFDPIQSANGYTLVQVRPVTGRLHQIRVHAASIGHAIAGDKLYGPDPRLMIEFIEHGYTGRVAELLPIDRHALHALELAFDCEAEPFRAPVAEDLKRFCDRVFEP